MNTPIKMISDMAEEEIAFELSMAPTSAIIIKMIEVSIKEKYNLTIPEFKAKWPEYFV